MTDVQRRRSRQPLCRSYERGRRAISISYGLPCTFGPMAARPYRWRCRMAHLVSGNDKFPDLGYDDDYRFYLITRRDASGDYRFARTQGKRVRVHARSALRRVNGYLK